MKFYGVVGYCYPEYIEDPDRPDIVEDVTREIKYYGDVLKNNRRWEKSEGVNDDLNISNRISIVADAFAYDHFFAIKYVEWMGTKWKVTDIEVDRPRLILSIGGVWNGNTSGTVQHS